MIHDFLSNYSPWLDTLIWNLNIPLQLQLKEKEKDEFPKKSQKINEKVILMYMVLIWTILYSVYKKCLNVSINRSTLESDSENNITHFNFRCTSEI